MKNVLSIETMISWKKQLDSDSSLLVFFDTKTNKYYSPRHVTEYVSGYFTDLKNGQLLVKSNKPLVGVRSLDGLQLSSGINQLVFEARILTDTTLGSSDTANEATLLTLPFASSAPAYLTNGEVTVEQNGQLLRTTGSVLCNKKAATSNDDDFVKFVPFGLKENVNGQITFNFAYTPVAKHAYRLEYNAVEFFETAKG